MVLALLDLMSVAGVADQLGLQLGLQQPGGGAKPVTQQAVTSTIIWVGVLIGLVLLAGGVLMWLRSRIGRESGSSSAGLFEEMRELHRQGKLSDEEFARVRARMSARVMADMDADGPRDASDADSVR